MSTPLPASQLSPHRATRVDLPGRYGPVAALHAPPATPQPTSQRGGQGGGDTDVVTVLLVPGYTGSKEDFAPLIDPIAASGIEVIAIDLPGQYESPGPEQEAVYRPGPLGAAVADLLWWLAGKDNTTRARGDGATGDRTTGDRAIGDGAIGDRAIGDGAIGDGAGGHGAGGHPVRREGLRRRLLVLGHSYGGLVARGAALAGAPITGLTLLGSGPAELPSGERRRALDDGELLLRTEGVAAAQRLRETRDATRPWWAQLPEELRTLLRTRFLSSSAAGLLGMADGLRYEPDLVVQLRKALRSSSAGCLVVCGEHDDAWPVTMQRDMADRLDADFAVVPRSAHSPNTENPEALLATLLPTWRAWLT